MISVLAFKIFPGICLIFIVSFDTFLCKYGIFYEIISAFLSNPIKINIPVDERTRFAFKQRGLLRWPASSLPVGCVICRPLPLAPFAPSATGNAQVTPGLDLLRKHRGRARFAFLSLWDKNYGVTFVKPKLSDTPPGCRF